ncbi:MAG: PIN domain-containing protein [archaeon]
MSADERIFVDTNILVYAYEKENSEKRAKCVKLVEKCFRGELDLYISNQVLAELSSVLLNKIEKPLPPEDVRGIIEEINKTESWKKISYDGKTVEKAVSGASPFWDALIGETMRENNILKIYTENTKDFERLEGIIPINPIKN